MIGGACAWGAGFRGRASLGALCAAGRYRPPRPRDPPAPTSGAALCLSLPPSLPPFLSFLLAAPRRPLLLPLAPLPATPAAPRHSPPLAGRPRAAGPSGPVPCVRLFLARRRTRGPPLATGIGGRGPARRPGLSRTYVPAHTSRHIQYSTVLYVHVPGTYVPAYTSRDIRPGIYVTLPPHSPRAGRRVFAIAGGSVPPVRRLAFDWNFGSGGVRGRPRLVRRLCTAWPMSTPAPQQLQNDAIV